MMSTMSQLPILPPLRTASRTHRKPYKKSTKGCTNCKIRKIKCDETIPCSNCRKKYVDPSCCKYSPSSEARSDTSSNTARSPLHRAISVTPIGVSSSHVLDLRLMHHYTKTVYSRPPQITGTAMYKSLWNFEIPQVAFSSEIVLNALLGLTSLNLLSLQPGDQMLSRSAWHHFDKAVVLQRQALAKMDARDAEPMVIAAIILAHYTRLASCSEAHSLPHPHPKKAEIDTYNMCKGVLRVQEQNAKFLEKYIDLHQVAIKSSADSSLDQHFMDLATRDMETLLLSLNKRDICQEDKNACQRYAEELMEIYPLLASRCDDKAGLEQSIITLLHRVPERFVEMLDVEDPTAMALLGRRFMCLELLEDSSAWWIHGAGSTKVPSNAIRGVYDTMPIEYKWLMNFPLQVVAKEVQILRIEEKY